jgi:hypothetical protein
MPTTDTELITKLIESTSQNRVTWQKTAVNDQFATTFGGKWTLNLNKGTDAKSSPPYYWVTLLDSGGKEILLITDSRLSNLFEKVRRQVLRIDEAIESIVKELDRKTL